jgi:uncharacterized protein YqeY
MSVNAQIQTDLVSALKNKDEVRVSTLRGMKSAIQKDLIDNKGSSDDDQRAFVVLKQEAKKRDDAIQAYRSAGRADLADKEAAELTIIQAYLPAQLSEADVKTALQPLVAASTDKNFGALMKQAMQQLNGQADGKIVSSVLKQLIAEQTA